MEFSSNDCVMVRCNKCGEEYEFFPVRVMALRECKCGNDDWGSPRDWKEGNFGNFTFIKCEEQFFQIK